MLPTKHAILLIDPHPATRRGVAEVIADAFPDPKTTGAETFADAYHCLQSRRIDLVVSEFRCGCGQTLPDFIARVTADDIATRFLAYSALSEDSAGVPAIRAGASGYLNKSAPLELLIDAIRTVLAGRTFIPESLTRLLADASLTATRADPARLLSPRELEIFTHLGRGERVSHIAATLNLSVKTVEAHRDHIKNKLNLHNAAQVTAAAVRWLDSATISI